MPDLKTDPIGEALLRHFIKGRNQKIQVYCWPGNNYKIETKYLLRSFDKMPAIEQTLLGLAKGSVLDVGAGAGVHTIYLQQKGLRCTAIDVSAGAVQVMQMQGVADAQCTTLMGFKPHMRYHTILLLMNGIGLAGTLIKLPIFLKHLKKLLQPGGQVLLDSSDLRPLLQDQNGNLPDLPGYHGEFWYRMEFRGHYTNEFPWLYADFETLSQCAADVGFKTELVATDGPMGFGCRLVL